MAKGPSINPVRGDQPRASTAQLSRDVKPATMNYRISGMRTATPRTTSSRTYTRG
jgi:hypothetical protein